MRFGAHCVLYGAEVGSDPQKIIGTLAKTGAEGCELGQRFFRPGTQGRVGNGSERESDGIGRTALQPV